jgi:hypothetical protein
MIPEFAITEWSSVVPWKEKEQVEQDLLICRALTEIYKDEYLAMVPFFFSCWVCAYQGGDQLQGAFLDSAVGKGAV